jgi:hypothetical protein
MIAMGLRRIYASALCAAHTHNKKVEGLVVLCDDLVWAAMQFNMVRAAPAPQKLQMEVCVWGVWHAVQPVHLVQITFEKLEAMCSGDGTDKLIPLQLGDHFVDGDSDEE